MAKKNYFAVVHKETGKFLLNSGSLPIYWNKGLATEWANKFSGYIVQPVNIKELERLVLSKSNKKAQ